MTELEMYELWLTLREWANYNQLNQTIEKNWLSNSFNSHIGKNTLVILVAHKFPIMFCSIILSSVLHVSIENEAVSFIAGTVVAAISIVGCLIVGRIMERICPVLIGKSTNS